MPETTLLYNPGVRTPYDRVEAFRTLRCPFCGTVEPNDMLLRNNHWLRPAAEGDGFDWCEVNGMCIGQNLVTNHIAYDAKALRDRDKNATGFKRFDEAKARAMLEQDMERGRALGIDPEKILAFFTTTTCKPCKTDNHDGCMGEATYNPLTEKLCTCGCESCAA